MFRPSLPNVGSASIVLDGYLPLSLDEKEYVLRRMQALSTRAFAGVNPELSRTVGFTIHSIGASLAKQIVNEQLYAWFLLGHRAA